MKRLVLLLIGFTSTIYFPHSWAGPSQYELDYSFARPLTIETRIFNGLRFNIIKPKDPFATFEGSRWMAELWGDNYLIIDIRSDYSNTGSVLVAERTEGEFSFAAMDKMAAKFGDQEQSYVVVTEWNGGRDYWYHVYSTRPKFKKILELNSTSDYYEAIAPNQLKFFVMNDDVEGLENCSMAEMPYDDLIYTFYPDRTEQETIISEVPECAKNN